MTPTKKMLIRAKRKGKKARVEMWGGITATCHNCGAVGYHQVIPLTK